MIRIIAIGETAESRYIGINPAIDDDISRQLVGELRVPLWLSVSTGYYDMTVDGQTSTEFYFDVSEAKGVLGSEKIDKATVKIALQLSDLIGNYYFTDKIELFPEIVEIDHATQMFGEKANDVRALIRQVNAIPNKGS